MNTIIGVFLVLAVIGVATAMWGQAMLALFVAWCAYTMNKNLDKKTKEWAKDPRNTKAEASAVEMLDAYACECSSRNYDPRFPK